MKLLNKIITIICTLSILMPYTTAFATSSDITVYVNEVFDNYATNSIPESVSVTSGFNARVVELEKNKVLYAGAEGCPVKLNIPIENSSSKMVFSCDIMISGDLVKGTALSLQGENTVSLLNYNPNHEITLEDGMRISGYSSNVWHNYAFAVDFDTGAYDLYIDGKNRFENRRFYTVPAKPGSVNFTFNCIDDNGGASIYFDNIRVYSGDEILNNIKSPGRNIEVLEYTLQERKPAVYDRIFLDSNGKTNISVSLTPKAGNIAVWEPMEEGGAAYLHFRQGGPNDCIGDINLDLPDDLTKYTYQFDVYVVKNTGTIRTANIDATMLFSLSGTSIMCNGVNAGKIELGKWVRIAATVDIVNEICSIYKDGKLLKGDIPLKVKTIPSKIRVGIAANSNAGTEVYFNKFKLYEGTTIREFEEADPIIFDDKDHEMRASMTTSIHEKASKTQEELGTDKVFMTSSDYFYAFGEKHLYSDYGAKSWVNTNGKVMVDARVLKFAFDSNADIKDSSITLNGKSFSLTKNGDAYFADVSDVANKLNKFVYDGDNRDFVIVSDKNKGYYNSLLSEDNRDLVDVIWRYMQFDRPDAEEVYKLLVDGTSFKSHPRLLLKKDEIPQFKNRINNNPELKKLFMSVLDKCDAIIESEPQERKLQTDGFRIFSSCATVKQRLFSLCTAYILTGNTKYAKRAWEEMDNACNWSDWNLETHFLDSGEIVPGIAFAYDTLYDYLTDEQKESIRRRVEKLYLDYSVGMFTGSSPDNISRAKYTQVNWGAVCGSSMLMIALTFMDEEDPNSLFTQKCKYIAAGTIQLFEHIATVVAPYGTWYEGGGYAEYVLQHFGWTLLSMNNVLGTDNNFLASPGVTQQPIYTMNVTTANGVFNKAATTGNDKYFCPETLIYARLTNRPDLMQLYNDYRKTLDLSGFEANYLLFYDPEYAKSATNSLPLDKNYDTLGTAVVRGSWTDEDALYLAISGGRTTDTGNNHYDKGSFIFEALGERWFIDMGRNGHNTMAYLVYAETHNNLVINPKPNDYGQLKGNEVVVIDSESKEKGAKFVYDLAPVYENDVKSYNRGFLVSDNRNTLVVQDELSLKKSSTLQWNFITKANIDISDDGKTAILTQAGKKLKVSVASNIPGWNFEVRDMAPTGGWVEGATGSYGTGSFTIAQQQKYAGNAKKLVISAKAKGDVNLSVKFTPQIEGESYDDAVFVPISQWIIPDGDRLSKPLLDEITVNGQPLPGFIPGIKEYRLSYPYGSSVPVFGASASIGDVEIIQASNWTESAQIKLTLPDGRYTIYRMNLLVSEKISENIMTNSTVLGLPATSKIADIKSVYASHVPQIENPAENAVDGKADTRWAANTDGAYIEVDLGSVQDLTGIAVSWVEGESRNYLFDILVSENKADYKRIYSGYSTGGTNDLEFIEAPVKARYVRYIGYGHKSGDWNSITEFRPAIAK